MLQGNGKPQGVKPRQKRWRRASQAVSETKKKEKNHKSLGKSKKLGGGCGKKARARAQQTAGIKKGSGWGPIPKPPGRKP